MAACILAARLPARALDPDGIEPFGAHVRITLDARQHLAYLADRAAMPGRLALRRSDLGFERLVVVKRADCGLGLSEACSRLDQTGLGRRTVLGDSCQPLLGLPRLAFDHSELVARAGKLGLGFAPCLAKAPLLALGTSMRLPRRARCGRKTLRLTPRRVLVALGRG